MKRECAGRENEDKGEKQGSNTLELIMIKIINND